MTPDPNMPMPGPMPEEDALEMPMASREIDAEAHAATKDLKLNRGFKSVPEDAQGGSCGDEPAGNR